MTKSWSNFRIDNLVRLDVMTSYDWRAVRIDMHFSRTIEWEDAEWQCVDPLPERYSQEWAL